MNMRILHEILADRIVLDIRELVAKTIFIRHAMGMIALLPNLPCILFAHCKGKSAFDELSTAFNGLIRCGSEQDMNMIRHRNKAMQKKASTIAIAK